jgi:hypothetical protein
MGDGRSSEAKAATSKNLALSDQMFDQAMSGLVPAQEYLGQAFNMGGMIDLNPKYDAMQSNFLDKTMGVSGDFRDPSQMGKVAGGRAAGVSGIAAQKIGEKFDIMNSIKSMLAGQGLKTTGMAASAEGLSVGALAGMAPNPTMSIIKGAGAAAAAGYGAGRDAGWWGGVKQTVPPGQSSVNPATGGTYIA